MHTSLPVSRIPIQGCFPAMGLFIVLLHKTCGHNHSTNEFEREEQPDCAKGSR